MNFFAASNCDHTRTRGASPTTVPVVAHVLILVPGKPALHAWNETKHIDLTLLLTAPHVRLLDL
jgi:hypothetical protein